MRNIILDMEFSVMDWIKEEKLEKEYNMFWADKEKSTYIYRVTGLTLIDFALYYCVTHKEDLKN